MLFHDSPLYKQHTIITTFDHHHYKKFVSYNYSFDNLFTDHIYNYCYIFSGSNDRMNAENLPKPPPPHSLSDPNLSDPRAGQMGSSADPNSTSNTAPYHSYSNQPTPSFHTFSPTHGPSSSTGSGGYHRTDAHANYGPHDPITSTGGVYNPRSVSGLPTPPPPCTRGGRYYGGRNTDSGSGTVPQRCRAGSRQPHVPASIPEESVITNNGHYTNSHTTHTNNNHSPHPNHTSPISPYNSKVRLKGSVSTDIVI